MKTKKISFQGLKGAYSDLACNKFYKEYEQLGAPYNLQYAEYFYYMPPGGTFTGSMSRADIDAYVAQHAVDL